MPHVFAECGKCFFKWSLVGVRNNITIDSINEKLIIECPWCGHIWEI